MRISLVVLLLCLPSLSFAAPAWCVDGYRADETLFATTATAPPKDFAAVLTTLIAVQCEAEYAGKADKFVADWSKRWMMTDDADWAAAAEYAQRVYAHKDDWDQKATVYAGLSPLLQFWWLHDPDQQYGADVKKEGHYLADAMGKLSAAGRLGYAFWCQNSYKGKEAHTAVCDVDSEIPDIKALVAEARADKTAPKWLQMAVRDYWERVQKSYPAWKKVVADMKAEDSAYAKAFDVAQKAEKDWDAQAAKLDSLLKTASEMESAYLSQSRKAAEGCDSKAYEALKGAIGTISAKAFAGVPFIPEPGITYETLVTVPILNTPQGYLGATAYVYCDLATGLHDHTSKIFQEGLGQVFGYRGPRTAALTAIAKAALVPDKKGQVIGFPYVKAGFNPTFDSPSGGLGIIAKLKKDGKKSTVEFQKVDVPYESCVKWEGTLQVTGFNSDGSLRHQRACLQYKTLVDKQAPRPVTIDDKFVSVLKPGMQVHIIGEALWTAFAKGGKSPNMVLGAAVK